MAQRLIFLRHGDASKAGVGDRTPLRARPLSATGRAQARAAGAFLAGRGLAVDALVVTGTRRSEETAALALAAMGGPAPAARVSPGGRSAAALLARAAGWMEGLGPDDALLFSGHGPNLRHLLRHFDAREALAEEGYGAVLILAREPGGWRLEDLHPRAG